MLACQQFGKAILEVLQVSFCLFAFVFSGFFQSRPISRDWLPDSLDPDTFLITNYQLRIG